MSIYNNNLAIIPFKSVSFAKTNSINKPINSVEDKNQTSTNPEWLGKDLLNKHCVILKDDLKINDLQEIVMEKLDIISRGDKTIYENLYNEFINNENNSDGLRTLIKNIEINIKIIEQNKIQQIKEKHTNFETKANELTTELIKFRYGYDLSGIDKVNWNTVNSYGVKYNEYLRAKNDAYCSLSGNEIIPENTNQHIFITPEQQKIYNKLPDTCEQYSFLNNFDDSNPKEILSTDFGIIYGLALNSKNDKLIHNLQNMNKKEIIQELKKDFNTDLIQNFGVDTSTLVDYFKQTSLDNNSESNSKLKNKLTELYDTNSEFKKNWNNFCSKNNKHFSSMCKELIMSDIGFIHALAINSNNIKLKNNLQNMTKEEIFLQLKKEFSKNSPKNFGIDTIKLTDFFERKTSSSIINTTTNNIGSGDKVIHEANKELANLFDRNLQFKQNWKDFCLKNKTFNEYFKLCDTYTMDYNNKLHDKPVITSIENLEHLIFRIIERDGSVSFDQNSNPISIIDELAELSIKDKSELNISSKKDVQCITCSNGMVLTLENSKENNNGINFHTIEYNSNDWDKMPYLPH